MSHCRRIECCRGCGEPSPEPVLDLGEQPLADGLEPTAEKAATAERYPLELTLCRSCGLLQLLETPPPELLFGPEFPYFSSVNPALVDHAGHLAVTLIDRLGLNADSRVIEIASNDGYLLKHFARREIPVLGIDPAAGPVAAARAAGVETVQGFFDADLAESLRDAGKQADLVVANNVLAHVPDPAAFVDGVAALLRPNGLAVFEVAWGASLLRSMAFDQIYHEHHCYFTAAALTRLLRRAGLTTIDIEPLSIHAGSLRVYAAHGGRRTARVDRLIEQEARDRLGCPETWAGMAHELSGIRNHLYESLARQHERGLKLAAYGAAAKGTMLLNWLAPEPDWIAWVADINPHKQGRFVPGVALPIVGPERIALDRPDRMLLLPWNWAEAIAGDQREWLKGGGRFIVPLPTPGLYP